MIVRQFFRAKPSLQEFVDIHKPQSIYQVEELERRYMRLVEKSSFFS